MSAHILFGSGVYVLLGIFFVYLLYPRDPETREIMAQFRLIHPLVPFITVALAVLAWPWYAFITLRGYSRKPRWVKDSIRSAFEDPDYWKKHHEGLAAKVELYIKENPACGRCGVAGKLSQYRGTELVICAACGGRLDTTHPSLPETAMAPMPPAHGPHSAQPTCSLCEGPAEEWMPMQTVESRPKYTRMEKVCYTCAKAKRVRGIK